MRNLLDTKLHELVRQLAENHRDKKENLGRGWLDGLDDGWMERGPVRHLANWADLADEHRFWEG